LAQRKFGQEVKSSSFYTCSCDNSKHRLRCVCVVWSDVVTVENLPRLVWSLCSVNEAENRKRCFRLVRKQLSFYMVLFFLYGYVTGNDNVEVVF